MILFGLAGGIGNCVMTLPAIKALSRVDSVALYVEGDYDMRALFARCRYVSTVYANGNAPPYAAQYLSGQYIPAAMQSLPVQRCGWDVGAAHYPWPEWEQVKRLACGNAEREDVSDWFEVEREACIDFALIPGGKPGDEWSRKKWPGFLALAQHLEARGHSVEAFGLADEIKDEGLQGWWKGPRKLEAIADTLPTCRVAISNDCGIGHLASSLGIPTVVLFTATSPVKGQPVGPHRIIARGCERAPRGCQSTAIWQDCAKWTCRDIPVDRVLAEAVSLLGRPIEESVP